MIRNELRLVPVTGTFTRETRSKYVLLIKQFLDRDEPELQVEGEDYRKMYQNLSVNIGRLKLQDKVGVRKRGKEIHLIRLG